MQQCGIENEQLVLVLEDHHVVDPSFLEIVNSLLSAGEVPGLYTPEELEPLLNPLVLSEPIPELNPPLELTPLTPPPELNPLPESVDAPPAIFEKRRGVLRKGYILGGAHPSGIDAAIEIPGLCAVGNPSGSAATEAVG